MNNRQCDIFISYRREGGDMTAMYLYQELKERGYDVFYDLEVLRSGNFNEALLENIRVCKDFVIVLSPHSLDRCTDENDWVRKELAEAIRCGKNIVPIMLNGFAFPDQLPEDIDVIRYQNGLSSSTEYFKESVTRLCSKYLLSKPKSKKKTVSLTLVIAVLVIVAAIVSAVLLLRPSSPAAPVPAAEPTAQAMSTPVPADTAVPEAESTGNATAVPDLEKTTVPAGAPAAEATAIPAAGEATEPAGTPAAEATAIPAVGETTVPTGAPAAEGTASPAAGETAVSAGAPAAEETTIPEVGEPSVSVAGTNSETTVTDETGEPEVLMTLAIPVMPRRLVDNGILNNDWLFSMPDKDDWRIELLEGEDLEARITDGEFWIDKVPEEVGTTRYLVTGKEKTYMVVLEKSVPNPLPEEAVLLNGNGEDIKDQTVSIGLGEKYDLVCHFTPDGWTFLGQEQKIDIWLSEGEGEMETNCEGTEGTLRMFTPGSYRIGVRLDSGNACAYRFFSLEVKEP
ncbi:MAG: TIR domain-containing protein [Clostridia bacterium]|nr:TIR domain-containing protein [Clostridia bacterium]